MSANTLKFQMTPNQMDFLVYENTDSIAWPQTAKTGEKFGVHSIFGRIIDNRLRSLAISGHVSIPRCLAVCVMPLQFARALDVRRTSEWRE